MRSFIGHFIKLIIFRILNIDQIRLKSNQYNQTKQLLFNNYKMQDKEARRKFNQLKALISESKTSQLIQKHEHSLNEKFSKLISIVNEYQHKKEENEKKYHMQVNTILESIMQEASNQTVRLDDLIQQKNVNWERLNNKMDIFMMLRQNLKQMFSLNSNGMNPAGKGEYESKNRKNN